ncbi:uncharacterized protein A1O5_02868 [Cladophialophora psammophila CBS 110553]|uniref:Uncharacterized protein n=1 Tax=Cladophialophora psammophila CBS 110553 TaxID=1182543 RepID=W9X271_9EURO|nr:uncharacterized protein A1O5_02868 [Cladophialophora psammophila CBS 110553]EXJ74572.1 hypothetical protein A1O5_02868 [Cladophialophora psammophila CBS 110553]
MVKQMHDVDNGSIIRSLTLDTPRQVEEIGMKDSTVEDLRELLNASPLTSRICTPSSTASICASSILTHATQRSSETSANLSLSGLDGGCEGKTVHGYSSEAEDPSLYNPVENERDDTRGIENTVQIQACGIGNTSVGDTVAFRFQGSDRENTLDWSPPKELQTFRFRHSSDSYLLKSLDINNSAQSNSRSVSLPARCADEMASCFLRWSGETLEEFIRGVEVADTKVDNKVRWLAVLQQPDTVAFLGRWPSPTTLKAFMRMHHLEWVVRVRGKWDWESKVAGAQESAHCSDTGHEEPPVEKSPDGSIGQDGLAIVEVEDTIEKHGVNNVLEPEDIAHQVPTDGFTGDRLVPEHSKAKEPATEDFVAKDSSAAVSGTPSWSATPILVGAAASAILISAFCPALAAVMLYGGISHVKSRLWR